MDLTRTCPTCSHIEDGSSLTCSFCGVELALNSENLPDTQVIDLSAGDEYIADDQVRDIQEEPSIEGPVPKPESLDAAIAHVLGAEPIADLLEEVEPSKPANPADGHSPHPEKTSAPSESRPNPLDPGPAVEGESNEGIVLPESVQLKSEDRADRVSAALNPGPAEAAAGTRAYDAKAHSLMKHRAALAKAEALKKRKLALAREAALMKKKMALQQMPTAPANIRLQKLLKPYQGKTIGINFDNSAVIQPAELIAVNGEYLSVLVKPKKLRYHFPLITVLSIIEGADGKGVPTGAGNEVYDAVVKIYPLVLF